MSKKSCSSKVLLNQEITTNKNYGNYDNYAIIYDLQSFQHSVDEDYHGEMALVAKLLESGMATRFLLEHPVMEVFLTVKYELMRPLFLMFEDDLESFSQDYEYMFGDDLLVAPVLEPGLDAWTVHLPGHETWVNMTPSFLQQ